MPEEYLQAAFEIKASCDEISRRILRWHWENKPGSHTLDALLEHIRLRQQESPAYYGNMPDVGRKTSWQQLDTTLCMRVLLDPERDAAAPLDLLGNTARPAAARRACNAVRTARNEAAHAADRAAGGQAAILFDEAVECLEAGYAGTAFSERELAKYYELADEYLTRCGMRGHTPAPRQPSAPEPAQTAPSAEVNVYPTGRARREAAASRAAGQAKPAAKPRAPRSQPAQSRRRAGEGGRAGTKAKGRAAGRKAPQKSAPRAALAAALTALALGLAARAAAMGLWPF